MNFLNINTSKTKIVRTNTDDFLTGDRNTFESVNNNIPVSFSFKKKDCYGLTPKQFKSFIKSIKDPKNIITGYEVLYANKPTRLFFDIEYETKKPNTSIVDKFYDDLFDYCGNNKLNQTSYMYIASRYKTDNVFKNSFRIIFPKIVFKSFKHMESWCNELKDHLQHKKYMKHNPIDMGIFSKVRLMRYPYCCKENDTQTKFEPYTDDDSENKMPSRFYSYQYITKKDDKYIVNNEITDIKKDTKPVVIKPKKNNILIKDNSSYICSTDQIKQLLDMLPATYYNGDYNKWIKIILLVCTSRKYNDKEKKDLMNILTDWSKQSKQYDSHSQNKIYTNLYNEPVKKYKIESLFNICKKIDSMGFNSIIKTKLNDTKVNVFYDLIMKYHNKKIDFDIQDEFINDIKNVIGFISDEDTFVMTKEANSAVIISNKQFKELFSKLLIEIPSRKTKSGEYIFKVSNAYKFIKKHIKKIIFKQRKFIPYSPKSSVVIDNTIYNTFKGINAKLIKKEDIDMKKIDKILYHVKNLLCGEDEKQNEIVLDWLSEKFTKMKKIKKCLVFISQPGVGKNIFWNAIKEIFHTRYCVEVSNLNSITRNFNGILANKLLFILNEASNGGSSSEFHKQNQIFKSLVTEDDFVMEKKNMEPIVMKNNMDFVLLSNNYHILKIEKNSRRYFCINGSTVKRDKKYYNELATQLSSEESRDHLYSFLMHRDIKTNFNERAHETKLLKKMKESQLNARENFIITKAFSMYEKQYVSSRYIKSSLSLFNNNNKTNITFKQINNEFIKLSIEYKRKQINGERKFVYHTKSIIDRLNIIYNLSEDDIHRISSLNQ
jgi:hypothetical protein